MFAHIEGILAENTASEAIVEINGIGYQILIPASALRHLPHQGKKIKFYTSFVIREFSQTLYGFISRQERDLFEVLMNVSGIGPKTALSVIGHLPLQDFQTAVARNDIVTITRVPGIGKKTAERLIIEIRDKLPNLFQKSPSEYLLDVPKDADANKIRDAMSALMNLGYAQNKAQTAIEKTIKDTSEGIDLASLITQALKNIK